MTWRFLLCSKDHHYLLHSGIEAGHSVSFHYLKQPDALTIGLSRMFQQLCSSSLTSCQWNSKQLHVCQGDRLMTREQISLVSYIERNKYNTFSSNHNHNCVCQKNNCHICLFTTSQYFFNQWILFLIKDVYVGWIKDYDVFTVIIVDQKYLWKWSK